MSICKDLTGNKYDLLTVVEKNGYDESGKILWRCTCECGWFISLTERVLKSKSMKHCGCLGRRKKRWYPVDNGKTFLIPVKNSDPAVIDKKSYHLVKRYSWFRNRKGYAVASDCYNGKRRTICMHRLILGAVDFDSSYEVDHGDQNVLNNVERNLSLVTRIINQQNRKKNRGKKYKGIKISGNGWKARIQNSKKRISLGSFKTEIEAAEAYDFASLQYFGNVAIKHMNFPKQINKYRTKLKFNELRTEQVDLFADHSDFF